MNIDCTRCDGKVSIDFYDNFGLCRNCFRDIFCNTIFDDYCFVYTAAYTKERSYIALLEDIEKEDTFFTYPYREGEIFTFDEVDKEDALKVARSPEFHRARLAWKMK